jgi:hypothetical protein
LIKHLGEMWEVIQWRKQVQAQKFQPHSALRPDLVFLAKLRYTDHVEQLEPHLKAWPMSPLMTSFVQQADRRNVGREGLILACLMETEATTFIPETVAAEWATSDRPSSAASQEAQTSAQDHPQTLLNLCRVLEDLNSCLECVYAELGVDSTRCRRTRKHKVMDVKLSVDKSQKTIALWWKIDGNNAWTQSKLSSAEKLNALCSALTVVFPECIAVRSGNRWFAAGRRVRGAALKAVANEEKVFLFQARPSPWKYKNDHTMVHLRPLFCAPVVPTSLSDQEDVIIISDSMLQHPGVMYGIACMLRKMGLNLLWFVSKGGAGAVELKTA